MKRKTGARPIFCYAMQIGDYGPVKLGYAADVQARRRHIQTAHVDFVRILAVWPAEVFSERAAHLEFECYCLRGEWFLPDPKLIERVCALSKLDTALDALRKRWNEWAYNQYAYSVRESPQSSNAGVRAFEHIARNDKDGVTEEDELAMLGIARSAIDQLAASREKDRG